LDILITGGAGFIGSHLSIRLLQAKHKLTIIDNFHPYYSLERKRAQLDEVKRNGEIMFYLINLTDEQAVKELFQTNHFDAVVHLAAIPGVPYSIEEPSLYIENNLLSTTNVLKWAGETNVKHVIFASSSSVYGDKVNIPLTEEMADGKVLSPYAATKVSGESISHVYQHLYGFNLTILRFFTVYGPWGRPDMAIPKFIDRLLDGKEIEIFGENSARDYTFIDDIVKGIELALEQPSKNEIYNLGSGTPITLLTLIEELRVFFPGMRLIHRPWRTGDVRMTWADINKAKEQLEYSPKIQFSEGLYKTIEWAKGMKR